MPGPAPNKAESRTRNRGGDCGRLRRADPATRHRGDTRPLRRCGPCCSPLRSARWDRRDQRHPPGPDPGVLVRPPVAGARAPQCRQLHPDRCSGVPQAGRAHPDPDGDPDVPLEQGARPFDAWRRVTSRRLPSWWSASVMPPGPASGQSEIAGGRGRPWRVGPARRSSMRLTSSPRSMSERRMPPPAILPAKRKPTMCQPSVNTRRSRSPTRRRSLRARDDPRGPLGRWRCGRPVRPPAHRLGPRSITAP